MKQVKLVKVEVDALVQGMYIAELDRPWLGSPFLLEGFLLEDVAQLEQLQSLCRHVMVDTQRSDFACTRMLLERLPPPPPDRPSMARLPPQRRAATTLMTEAVAGDEDGLARRSLQERSFFSDFRTIMAQTLAGGESHGAGGDGPTAWQDLDHAESSTPTPTGSHDAATATAPGARSGTAGQPIIYSAGTADTWDGKERRKWARPAPVITGLDTDADREQLGGSSLIVPRERGFAAAPELVAANTLHERGRVLVGEFLADVRAQRELNLDQAQAVIGEMADSILANPDPLVWLTYLKKEDDYAYKHAIDCAVLLMNFGRHLGYPRETLQSLGLAGLLQDVGKIRVPEVLRSHAGRFSSQEYREMRRHVEHSIDILHTIPGIGQKVLETVVQHHERMDGSGYPLGLKGTEISPLACMAAIVDAYAALVSDRPHAPAQPIHAALQTLERYKRHHFHESLVEQFMQCIGIYPVGTLVELNSAEVGVVVNQNRVRRLKPTVMVLLDPEHQPYPYPGLLNLMQDPVAGGDTLYRIVRDLPPGSYDLDPTEFFVRAA